MMTPRGVNSRFTVADEDLVLLFFRSTISANETLVVRLTMKDCEQMRHRVSEFRGLFPRRPADTHPFLPTNNEVDDYADSASSHELERRILATM